MYLHNSAHMHSWPNICACGLTENILHTNNEIENIQYRAYSEQYLYFQIRRELHESFEYINIPRNSCTVYSCFSRCLGVDLHYDGVF